MNRAEDDGVLIFTLHYTNDAEQRKFFVGKNKGKHLIYLQQVLNAVKKASLESKIEFHDRGRWLPVNEFRTFENQDIIPSFIIRDIELQLQEFGVTITRRKAGYYTVIECPFMEEVQHKIDQLIKQTLNDILTRYKQLYVIQLEYGGQLRPGGCFRNRISAKKVANDIKWDYRFGNLPTVSIVKVCSTALCKELLLNVDVRCDKWPLNDCFY